MCARSSARLPRTRRSALCIPSTARSRRLCCRAQPPCALRALGPPLQSIDPPRAQNELGILEFIHALVETLDKYFENVCELDIMFNLEKAHFIVEEMVMNGQIVETNKANVLTPIKLIEEM